MIMNLLEVEMNWVFMVVGWEVVVFVEYSCWGVVGFIIVVDLSDIDWFIIDDGFDEVVWE